MNRIERERLNAEIEERERIRACNSGEFRRQLAMLPRVCNDCLAKTVKVVCPRCGGQTDIDETSDYYPSSMEG